MQILPSCPPRPFIYLAYSQLSLFLQSNTEQSGGWFTKSDVHDIEIYRVPFLPPWLSWGVSWVVFFCNIGYIPCGLFLSYYTVFLCFTNEIVFNCYKYKFFLMRTVVVVSSS